MACPQIRQTDISPVDYTHPLCIREKVQLLHTAVCDFDNDLELTEQVQYNEIDVIALIYYIPREEN